MSSESRRSQRTLDEVKDLLGKVSNDIWLVVLQFKILTFTQAFQSFNREKKIIYVKAGKVFRGITLTLDT
jgi:hypothetical protein